MEILIKRFASLSLLIVAFFATSALHADALTFLPHRPDAPVLELPDISGKTRTLEDMRGRVVLINFWATWCPPCRAEIPSLQRLRDQFSNEDFSLLAVNVGESRKDISRFFFSMHTIPTFTILTSNEQIIPKQWPIRSLPTTFIVDKSGRVTHVASGARFWDSREVMATIQQLLNADQTDEAWLFE